MRCGRSFIEKNAKKYLPFLMSRVVGCYMSMSVMLSVMRNVMRNVSVMLVSVSWSMMLVTVSWSVRMSMSWSVRLSVFVRVNFGVHFGMIDRHAHVTEFPVRVAVLRVVSAKRK